MAFAQAAQRPIPGAVATLGVSERVAFLRRTYALLGFSLIAWAALTAGLFRFATALSLSFSQMALASRWSWLIVILLFSVTGSLANRLAMSQASRTTQYIGLAVQIAAWTMLMQPMLWILVASFPSADVAIILKEAVVITLAVFAGLTATVFISKKDFSFLRGILSVASLGFLALIVVSLLFGFQMGALYSCLGIAIMAGYILYQTSSIMKTFPPSYHVAAALMLFSTVATLFWYVLNLLMSRRR